MIFSGEFECSSEYKFEIKENFEVQISEMMARAFFLFLLIATTSKLGCGTQVENSRIKGGKMPETNWYERRNALVYIIRHGSNGKRSVSVKCAGSFAFSNRILITSASCFMRRKEMSPGKFVAEPKLPENKFKMYVVSAKYKVSSKPEFVERNGAPAYKLFVHKYFSGFNYNANLAVITLTAEKVIAPYDQPDIGSPPRSGTSVDLVGFRRNPKGEILKQRLRRVSLKSRKYDSCYDPSKWNSRLFKPLKRYMTCTSPARRGDDGCFDYGAPLYRSSVKGLALYGLYGIKPKKCGEKNSITWYTRLDAFQADLNYIFVHTHNMFTGTPSEKEKTDFVSNWYDIKSAGFGGWADSGGKNSYKAPRYPVWNVFRRTHLV